jgi:hypothetical protein
VTRPFSGGGQWFIDTSSPVTGQEAEAYNPGGGFGQGTSPFPVGNFFPMPEDLAFTLSGDLASTAPEPTSLTLLGIGTLGLLGNGLRRKQQVSS